MIVIYVVISVVTGILSLIYSLRLKGDKVKRISLVFTAGFCLMMALLIHYNVVDGVYFLLNVVFYGVISRVAQGILKMGKSS